MRTLCSVMGIAALTLAGCASQQPVASRPDSQPSLPELSPGQSGFVVVRFESKPMGATVVRNGVKLGRTPLFARVAVRAYSEEGQTVLACTSRERVALTWESGASTTVTGICSQYPTVTAERPADAPGLDKDLRAEAQDRTNRENAATAARISNSWGPFAPKPAEIPRASLSQAAEFFPYPTYHALPRGQ
jgi:hypothetical protein